MVKRWVSQIRRDAGLWNLLRHSGVLYVAGALSIILTLIQQVSTARLLGSSDYGRLATVLGSSAFAMLIIDVRTWELGTKLMVRPALERAHCEIVRIVTWLTLVDTSLGILGAGLLLALARLIATYLLKAPDLDGLVRLYAIGMPFRGLALGIAYAVIRFYNRYTWLAAKSVLYALARLLLISGAALAGLGLAGALVGVLVGEVLNAAALVIMAWATLRCEAVNAPLPDLAKPKCFAEGKKLMGQLWISATLKGFHLQLFVPTLALLTEPGQVGLFRAGMDVAETITKLVEPIAIVLFPDVVKQYERNTRPEFVRYIRQSMTLLLLFVGPLVMAIILIGPWFFPVVFSEGYAHIASVTGLLAVGYGVNAIFLWMRPALVALNRIREQNVAGFATAILVMLLLLLMVPYYGAVGGAVVMVGFFAIYMAWSYLIFRRGLVQDRRMEGEKDTQ